MMRRFGIVVMVVVALVFAGSTGSQATVATTRVLPAIDLSATPTGWVPVADGDVQISVPATWSVLYNEGCPTGSPPGEVLVNAVAEFCAPFRGPRNLVWLYLPATLRISYQHRRVINGLSVYGDLGNYFVPSFRLQVSLSGPLAQRVLHTLSRSPRTVALASGPAPVVPSSWQTVTFQGLAFSAPASWPVTRSSVNHGIGQPCSPGVTLWVAGVVLSTDVKNYFYLCPAPVRPPGPQIPQDGVQVDAGSQTLRQDGMTVKFSKHSLKLHGLTACPATSPAYSILVLKVTVPGRLKPVYVSIGLAGNGMVARTILYSLREA
jgi:hypothetical protein